MPLLNKHNLNIADLASKDESRYTLNSVQVSSERTAVTDGKVLVTVTLPSADIKNYPVIDGITPAGKDFKSFLLPADAAHKIRKAIPNGKNIPILKNVLVGEGTDSNACFAVTDLDCPQIFKPRMGNGTFPHIDAVTPKEAAVTSITFDAALLAGVLKQVQSFKADDSIASFKLELFGPDKAARITAKNRETEQELMALIMPCRE